MPTKHQTHQNPQAGRRFALALRTSLGVATDERGRFGGRMPKQGPAVDQDLENVEAAAIAPGELAEEGDAVTWLNWWTSPSSTKNHPVH